MYEYNHIKQTVVDKIGQPHTSAHATEAGSALNEAMDAYTAAKYPNQYVFNRERIYI